ncbi:MAG: hypothetical protein RL477_1696 [Pseudomonadota bacterium]|jgi:hypothetical protein
MVERGAPCIGAQATSKQGAMAQPPTNARGSATLNIGLVLLVTLTLGAPLICSFTFAGLGALVWLVAAFGWLPGDWFVNNLNLLGTTAAVITAPVIAWVLYRVFPRVVAAEQELSAQKWFVPNLTPPSPKR